MSNVNFCRHFKEISVGTGFRRKVGETLLSLHNLSFLSIDLLGAFQVWKTLTFIFQFGIFYNNYTNTYEFIYFQILRIVIVFALLKHQSCCNVSTLRNITMSFLSLQLVSSIYEFLVKKNNYFIFLQCSNMYHEILL